MWELFYFIPFKRQLGQLIMFQIWQSSVFSLLQRSVLGPSFFRVYANQFLSFSVYADITQPYISFDLIHYHLSSASPNLVFPRCFFRSDSLPSIIMLSTLQPFFIHDVQFLYFQICSTDANLNFLVLANFASATQSSVRALPRRNYRAPSQMRLSTTLPRHTLDANFSETI